jgi:beta-galactosidase
MNKFLIGFLFVCCLTIQTVYATTSGRIIESDKGDERLAILENNYLKVVFSSRGGRLTQLTFKPDNRDLTWGNDKSDSGALKDQFAPQYFKFRDLNYEMRLLKNTPEEVSLHLKAKGERGAWNFITLAKTVTLKKHESRLSCSLEISNQAESMGEFEFSYWSHNLWGTKKKVNTVYVPTKNGVVSYIPTKKTNNDFYRDLTRGWIAIADSDGAGVVNVFDCRYCDAVYSWYCRAGLPLDTVEWRLLPITLQAGKSFKTEFTIGVFDGMPRIGGAGAAGVGYVKVPEIIEAESIMPVTISLEGFADCKADVDVFLYDSAVNRTAGSVTEKVSIKTGRVVVLDITVPSGALGTKVLTVNVASNGKDLFDIQKIIQVGNKKVPVKLVAKEKPIKQKKALEPWAMVLSEHFETPHYKWSKPYADGKLNALFLLPTKGARDVVELMQRMDLNVTFPTIYPSFFGMAWRTVTNPKRGENGLKYLKKIMANQKYDLIVIGGDVQPPWGKNRMQWKAFPEHVRMDILKRVKNGAGLVYINPQELDDNMKKVMSALKPLKLNAVDVNVAPFMGDAVIRGGNYGKGRIVAINYKTRRDSALLTPHPGLRTSVPHSVRNHTYRFQDYQFAVLAKALLYAAGDSGAISNIAMEKQGAVIELSGDGQRVDIIHVDLFDKFSHLVWSGKVKPEDNRAVLALPIELAAGKNFIHAVARNKQGHVVDFGYLVINGSSPVSITKVHLDHDRIQLGDFVTGRIATKGKLPDNTVFDIQIKDVLGRIVFHQKGNRSDFAWNTTSALKRLHEISVKLVVNGTSVDEVRKKINVIGTDKTLKHFPFMLWGGCQSWPEYVMPYVYQQLAKFGFNMVYTGGFADSETVKDLELSRTAVSSNWFAKCGCLHTRAGLERWQKTHDKKYLVRPKCLNDPQTEKEALNYLDKCMEKIAPFGSQKIFQLGDEMSVTSYQQAWDVCFSPHCLKKFRLWLKKEYGSLVALNQEWDTQFKHWDEVMPMTRIEILTRKSPAPWTDHREFMDLTFSDFLLKHKKKVNEKFTDAFVGPTGVLNTPAVYGGNWNFWNMSQLDMISSYGAPRLPLSFNRNKRLIMRYRGYNYTEADTANSLWEGLFLGERGANHWCAPVYIQPDLTLPNARAYYSNLLWELRSGLADLFYNSEKLTNDVAIHYSQASLRANYLKAKKKSFYDNCLSYCYALEDLGIGYRFVSWEEVENGALGSFKALILPESSALSKKEVAAIEHFTANGGTVIGDYEIGLLNKHCKPLTAGCLDDLFGILQRKPEMVKVGSLKTKGRQVETDYIGTGITSTSGTPQATVEVSGAVYPLLVSNKYKKGRTHYLNFRPNYSNVRNIGKGDAFRILLGKLLGIERKVKILRDGNDAAGILCTQYKNGDNYYIGLLPRPPSGSWKKMSLKQLQDKSFDVTLAMKDECYLYDVRNKKYLGYAKNFKSRLTPGLGAVFAALPYKVKGIDVHCPDHVTRGDVLKVSISLLATSKKASHHIFLVELFNPQGQKISHYRQVVESHDGNGNIELPIALNDAPGAWRLTVTDTASGQQTSKDFTIR